MEQIWLKNYPPGIPAEVDVNAFASLMDVLQRSCQRFGDLPAYSNMGASITYDELDRSSRHFAAYLQKSLGLRKADRVALMMPNLLQYPVALFGMLRAGPVVVNVNPQYTAPELEHQLKDSGAVAIVVLENFAHTLQEVLDRNQTLKLTVITTAVGDMFPVVKELFVCALPLYHVYALTSSLVFMKTGAPTILVTNPRDMHAFIHDLKKYPFTVIITVNTLYRALLDAPEFVEVDTRALKLASAGGMAVQRIVAERWKKRTGVPIVEGYGLTETSAVVISNPINVTGWTGTIGMSMPSTQASILDKFDHEAPLGEVGEICVRCPQVMAGYWNRPDETDKVFTPDGWLRTGDMGLVDERGCFHITDRKNDMIIVSGFKVFPNQIDDAVALHPGLAEVAAIGAG